MKKLNLCFSTLGCTEYSVEDVIALSERFSLDAIELRGLCGKMNVYDSEDFSAENAEASFKKFFDRGISFKVLGTSVSCHEVFSGKQTLDQFTKDVEFAKTAKAGFVRVFGNKITENCSSEEIAGVLLSLCEIADPYGVTVLLEVHGDYNSIETLSPILKRLSKTENFGLIWDICHTDAGYGDGWEEFYLAVKPYIKHVHIKDRIRQNMKLTSLGKGDIPIKAIAERLSSDGFDGYVSLEWERKWHPELCCIEEALSDFVAMMRD